MKKPIPSQAVVYNLTGEMRKLSALVTHLSVSPFIYCRIKSALHSYKILTNIEMITNKITLEIVFFFFSNERTLSVQLWTTNSHTITLTVKPKEILTSSYIELSKIKYRGFIQVFILQQFSVKLVVYFTLYLYSFLLMLHLVLSLVQLISADVNGGTGSRAQAQRWR